MQICAHCQLPKSVCYALTLYQRSHAVLKHRQKRLAGQYAEEADAVFDQYMASITKTAKIIRFRLPLAVISGPHATSE